MTYPTSAIILRRRDVGEWDRLYTCYTRERGKLTLLGKGTCRPRAKLAAHLEPYAEVDLVVAHGRAVDRVTFARVVRSGVPFAQSWEMSVLVAFCAEAVDQLTREGERDPSVYDLLSTFLTQVSIPHSIFRIPSSVSFSLRLCALLGYTPRMDRCLECRGVPGPAPVTGFPERGGFACHRCRVSGTTGIPLTVEDCGRITQAAARFSANPCSDAVGAFARALVACHAWQPLRTAAAIDDLTGARGRSTLASS